ncbi:MAG: dihydrofolate reductase family protein [Bacteroidota bacterium]
MKRNIASMGISLDGFIAGKNDELDWLDMIPNPEGDDLGYFQLMEDVTAIVMGRNSFETVLGFDIDWPYKKHVYVLSSTLKTVPVEVEEKVTILNGTPREVLEEIHKLGHESLYIDGGITVQNFLKEDLIDEMRITTVPIILGGGIPLYGELDNSLEFELIQSKVYLNHLVQSCYKRKR